MEIIKKRLVSQVGALYSNYMAMVVGKGLVIAAGKIDYQKTGNAVMTISRDGGNTWTDINSGVPFDIYGMCYGKENAGGLFVAVGRRGNIAYSSDGIRWTKANVQEDGNSYTDVSYSSDYDIFCTVGVGGKIMYSTNGVNWSRQASNIPSQLAGVKPCPEGFLTVGSSGAVGVSRPGSNLTNLKQITSLNLYGCTYHPGLKLYLAGGQNSGLFYSRDGVNWSQRSQPSYMAYFWKIENVRGRCVTVGNADKPFPTGPNAGKPCAFFAVSANGLDYVRYYTPDGDLRPTAFMGIDSDENRIYLCGSREYLAIADPDWS